MKVIGLHGLARSGKSTASTYLSKKYKLTEIALADPMKRFLHHELGFTQDSCWGPSERREDPHHEYAREEPVINDGGDVVDRLIIPSTARYVLQKMGTEFGRRVIDEDVWVVKAFATARDLVKGDKCYDAVHGLTQKTQVCEETDIHGVIISDVRYMNELQGIRFRNGKLLKITRPGEGLQGSGAAHSSEGGLEDDHFDAVVVNDGSPEDLYASLDAVMKGFWS